MASGDPTTESIGERIRRVRLEQGKSQREIEGPGADHAHISRVEAGQRRATDDFLRTVARNLGVTVEYLRDGDAWDARRHRLAQLDDLELRLRLGGDGAAEMVRELRSLHAGAVADGDTEVARRCRVLIGCSASDRGEHGVAIRELERLVTRGQVSCATEPDVYLNLARSLTAVGRADEAVSQLEACLEEARQQDDDIGVVRFATHLSFALVDAGETRPAKRVLAEASTRAENIGDIWTRVRIYWSRARIAWAERDWVRGRADAQRAIMLYEEFEDRRALARLHMMCADMSLMAGDVREAEASIEQAKRHVEAGAEAHDLGTLRYQQAFVAASNGDGDEALRLAQEAVELLREDPAWQARARWALAHAHAAAGRHEDAARAFEDAYPLVRIERRFIAEFLHAWSSTLCELGREQEAARVFMSAVEEGVLTSADLK